MFMLTPCSFLRITGGSSDWTLVLAGINSFGVPLEVEHFLFLGYDDGVVIGYGTCYIYSNVGGARRGGGSYPPDQGWNVRSLFVYFQRLCVQVCFISYQHVFCCALFFSNTNPTHAYTPSTSLTKTMQELVPPTFEATRIRYGVLCGLQYLYYPGEYGSTCSLSGFISLPLLCHPTLDRALEPAG